METKGILIYLLMFEVDVNRRFFGQLNWFIVWQSEVNHFIVDRISKLISKVGIISQIYWKLVGHFLQLKHSPNVSQGRPAEMLCFRIACLNKCHQIHAIESVKLPFNSIRCKIHRNFIHKKYANSLTNNTNLYFLLSISTFDFC